MSWHWLICHVPDRWLDPFIAIIWCYAYACIADNPSDLFWLSVLLIAHKLKRDLLGQIHGIS